MATTALFNEQSIEDAPIDLPRKKWTGKKISVIAGGVMLLCAVALGYALFAGVFKARPPKAVVPDAIVTYVDTPDIIVNINAGQGKTKFLKLGITLSVRGTQTAARIKASLPRVIDSFQIYMRELRVEDITGSAGMFLLKEELLRRVNTELAPDHIDDVLFKEMLLQ